jgi:hypothetical protein
MNTMMNLKYKIGRNLLMLLTLGMMWGCTTDDGVENRDKVSVMLSISVRNSDPLTRSDVASFVGKTPVLDHIWAFFVEDGAIKVCQKGELREEGNVKMATFNGIPSSINEIYVIGYPTSTNSPDASNIVPGQIISTALKAIMVDLSNQSRTDATSVNTFGSLAVDFSGAADGQSISKTIEIYPAISRVEIKTIDPSNPGSLTVKGKITKFDLDAIYINNIYTKLALDNLTKPATAATDSLAFGGNNIASGSPWDTSVYPAAYCDVVSGTGKSNYSPANGAWGYYVTSLEESAGGTVINGAKQGVLPHIILKVSNIQVNGSTNIVPGPLFLTVKRYKDASTGQEIQSLQPGYVYQIDNLAFGMEHLAPLPEVDAPDIQITMKVVDWVDELISGGID